MIPVKQIDPEDLPLYAMQLLPVAETDDLRENLQHSAPARRVLAETLGDLSLFALTAEMHAPPATARPRLMKQVAREKKAQPAVPLPTDAFIPRTTSSLVENAIVERSFARQATPWVGWLLAAGLAAFAFIEHQKTDELSGKLAAVRSQNVKVMAETEAAQQVLETLNSPAAVHATLVSAESHLVPSGRVTYVAEKGSLVFIASNLEPLAAAKTYELWVIPADGRAPMPAGTFKPDTHGNASVMLPELTAGIEAKAFGVTIEDGEGSATPTAPIVLKGLPG